MVNFVKEEARRHNYTGFHQTLKFQSCYLDLVNKDGQTKQEKYEKIISDMFTGTPKTGPKGQMVPDYLVEDHPEEIP